ncbi:MAP3K12-binding inhibitory protein 1 isoform X2 [Xenopus laevis]|uniref:MAP3K12-binding inhibitory protein 1 isoform X2 n=1 Tax=Xenopus laevis TaxID=8355 RepID=A0A8J1LKN4_XENLA|nr:MAP3K12-binding inhibitory protein 1 isoform X2 [Xenopus laevis]
MDFLETQQPEKVGEEGVISHSYEEALKVTENSVRFDINWDSLQCLPDAKPALLCSLLQQHVAHIQPFIDKLQALVKEDVHRNDSSAKTQNVAEKGDHELMDIEADGKITPESSSDEFLRTSDCFDPSVVQIKAKKSEIDRRILAFIERKQAEINENNVREFCNVIDCNQENSCARTDAVFTPYPGFKSHIKVSRVVNTYGPQTRKENTVAPRLRPNPLQLECGNQAVEERLQNIESHLRLQRGGPVPKDVYQRIKRLEDRILELEGISPEYFNSVDISKKRKAPQTSENYSLAEIDQKIKTLKQSLLQKSSRFNAEAMQT